MTNVNIAVEGIIDTSIAKRLLEHVGLVVGKVYGERGKGYILKSLSNFNCAAHFAPWFVVVDLDNDTVCASQSVGLWLPKSDHETGMCFRIAVRQVEAWIMADTERLASFLSISASKLPSYPDQEANAKETLIKTARTSKDKRIREDMVARKDLKEGPGYALQMIMFIEDYWRPDEAVKHSESLRRCINALHTLKSWNKTDL